MRYTFANQRYYQHIFDKFYLDSALKWDDNFTYWFVNTDFSISEVARNGLNKYILEQFGYDVIHHLEKFER